MVTKATRELILASVFGYAVYVVLAVLFFPHTKDGLTIAVELGAVLVTVDLARIVFASYRRRRERLTQKHH
jgi:uncharacterized membrane protein